MPLHTAALATIVTLAATLQPAEARTPTRPLAGVPLYLASGDRVRLSSPSGAAAGDGPTWLEGSILAVDTLALTISTPTGAPRRVRLDAITRLQIHRPARTDSLGHAGAAGTLVGFLAGAAMGAMACSGSHANSWVALLPEACGFATGLGGALLGARVARGDPEDSGWIPVPLPLRLTLVPGRRLLTLTAAF